MKLGQVVAEHGFAPGLALLCPATICSQRALLFFCSNSFILIGNVISAGAMEKS
jgi:hypothetical protein